MYAAIDSTPPVTYLFQRPGAGVALALVATPTLTAPFTIEKGQLVGLLPTLTLPGELGGQRNMQQSWQQSDAICD